MLLLNLFLRSQTAREFCCCTCSACPWPGAGLVVGVVAGVGAAGVAVFAGLFWLQGHGRRNNSAAPKDERKPFCVLAGGLPRLAARLPPGNG